jgi:hypothetical protein
MFVCSSSNIEYRTERCNIIPANDEVVYNLESANHTLTAHGLVIKPHINRVWPIERVTNLSDARIGVSVAAK